MPAIMDQQLAQAIALHKQGRIAEAESAYRRILAANPLVPEAHNALGIALQQQGKPDQALPCFATAVRLKPDYAGAHSNMGAALQLLGRIHEAMAAFERALVLDPNNAEARYNLASALHVQERLAEAEAGYRQVLAAHPGHVGAWNNLGIALRGLGRLDEAAQAYGRAIQLAPAIPDHHYNLAMALLEAGELARGWAEHEWRIRAGITPDAHAGVPRWAGDDPKGRTILVWAEQGLGDSLNFCRYLPMLATLGAKVVFEVQAPLAALCRASMPDITVVARGEPLPAFELQVPLLSLPHLMGTETVAAIPATGAYLTPSSDSLAYWRHRLGTGDRRRIGLVWSGNKAQKNNHNRSVPFERLAPLFALDGIEWVSLQVGDPQPLPAGVTDLADGLSDFDRTAGAMACLDLVVSVDTSVLHLAGAMNHAAIGMLCFAPDWRWLRGFDSSPWYPAMRLIRQEAPGDWDGVVERLAQALSR
jgi:Flp pilus assembly protein TadD